MLTVSKIEITAATDWQEIEFVIGDDVHPDMQSEFFGYYDKQGHYREYPDIAYFEPRATIVTGTGNCHLISAAGISSEYDHDDGNNIVFPARDDILDDLVSELQEFGLSIADIDLSSVQVVPA